VNLSNTIPTSSYKLSLYPRVMQTHAEYLLVLHICNNFYPDDDEFIPHEESPSLNLPAGTSP